MSDTTQQVAVDETAKKAAKKDKRPAVIRYLTNKVFKPQNKDEERAKVNWEVLSPPLLGLKSVLDGLPGAETQRKALTKATTEALNLAAGGDYAAAMRSLKAANVSKLVEEGRKASEKLGKAVSANDSELGKKYNSAKAEIEKMRDVLPSALMAKFLSELDQAVVPIAQGRDDPAQSADNAIDAVVTNARKQASAIGKVKSAVDETFQSVTGTMQVLSSSLTDKDNLQERHNLIATLIQEHEYESAKEPIRRLAIDLGKLAPASAATRFAAVSNKVLAAQNELRALPGAASEFSELRAVFVRASKAEDSGDVIGALRVFEAANIEKIVQHGRQANDACWARAEENYPKLTQKIANLKATISGAGGRGAYLGVATRDDLLKQLQAAAAPLYMKNVDAAAAETALGEVEEAIRGGIIEAERSRATLQNALQKFTADLTKANNSGLIAVADDDKLNAVVPNVSLAINQGKFDAAGKQLKDLVDRLNSARSRTSALKSDVPKAANSLANMETRAEKLTDIVRTSPGLPWPSALPTPDALGDTISRLKAEADPDLIDDIGDFLAEVEVRRSELEQVEAYVKAASDSKVKSARGAADGKVETAQVAATKSLSILKAALEKAGKAARIAGPPSLATQFETRLDTIVATWRESLASTVEVAKLDPDPTVSALTTLRSEIDARSNDPPSIEASMLDDLLTQALAQIRKRAQEIRTDIDQLARFDVIRADKASAGVDAVVTMAERSLKNYDAKEISSEVKNYLELLGDTAESAGEAIATLSRELADRQAEIQRMIDLARNKLAAFSSWIEKRPKVVHGPANVRGESQEANYSEMRDGFAQRLDEAIAVSQIKSARVLQQTASDLGKLALDIDSALDAAKAERKGSDAPSTIGGFLKMINEHKVRLTDKRVTTYCARSANDLMAKLLQLEGSIKAMSIAEGEVRLAEIGQEIETLEAKVDTGESAFLTFDKPLQTQLVWTGQKDGDFGKFPALQAKLIARLEACQEMAKQEGKLAAAKAEFKKIEDDIDAALAGSGKNMRGMEKAAADEKEVADKEVVLFKARCDAFEKRAQSLSGNQKDEVVELIDIARKISVKTQSGKAAEPQLGAARQRLEYFEKYPQGVAYSKNADLTKVAQKWASAAADLRAVMEKLVTRIENIPDADAPQPVKKTVKDKIMEVRLLLSPVAFDAAASQLQSTDMKLLKKRLGLRERGLRAVSKAISVLENDPRLIMLSDNPFETSVRTAIVAARLAALDMQQTLIACI